jgi:hypothetical protein
MATITKTEIVQTELAEMVSEVAKYCFRDLFDITFVVIDILKKTHAGVKRTEDNLLAKRGYNVSVYLTPTDEIKIYDSRNGTTIRTFELPIRIFADILSDMTPRKPKDFEVSDRSNSGDNEIWKRMRKKWGSRYDK